jgi:hypothetical protein
MTLIVPARTSPLATWPRKWLPSAPAPFVPPGGGSVVEVQLSGASGTQTLAAVPAGGLLLLAQVEIDVPFDAGSSILLGTSAAPDQFLEIADAALPPSNYDADYVQRFAVDDFLIVTVSPSAAGSARLYYQLQ